MKHLEFVGITSAEEVLGKWHKSEENSPELVKYFRSLDYETAQAFRRELVDLLDLKRLQWDVFRAKNLTSLLDFLAETEPGPFLGWKNVMDKYLQGGSPRTFGNLAEVAQEWALKHNRIPDIARNLPTDIQLVGMHFQGGNGKTDRTFILDGCHRTFGLLFAEKMGEIIDLSRIDLTIALTQHPQEEIGIIDEILRKKAALAKK